MDLLSNKKGFVMNKILVGGLVIFGIFTVYYLNIDDNVVIKQTSSKNISSPQNKTPIKVRKQSVEIVYLDDNNEKETKANSKILEAKRTVSRDSKNNSIQNNSNYDPQNEKYINEYIESNNLIEIVPSKTKSKDIPRFSVYADISLDEAKKKQNKMMPPSAPLIVNGSFSSGTIFTVVIPSEIKQAASHIAVVDNNPDGTKNEIIDLLPQNLEEKSSNQDTQNEAQDLTIMAPPSIGQ